MMSMYQLPGCCICVKWLLQCVNYQVSGYTGYSVIQVIVLHSFWNGFVSSRSAIQDYISLVNELITEIQ
jgi:hypothetical protein